ncbi:MAG TPA: hydrogenase [Burkholderiaceae bacterium]|nr:hydrogenase [Burkholderiaceae bacterium]
MTLHPLVERLLAHPATQRVDAATLDAWLEAAGDGVLFFSGDPVRFPEGTDVAVVLPELRAALGQGLRIGVVARADEDALARRVGVQRWPSLVFLRDGAYLGTVSGMQDWDVFLRDAAQVLAAAPRRLPSIGIPVVAAESAGHCH